MGSLIILVGSPGVGKTTTAKNLSQRLGAVHICPDEIYNELVNGTVYEDVYNTMLQLSVQRSKAALDSGRSVVLDSFFQNRETLGAMLQQLKGPPQYVFELRAPFWTCRKRMNKRRHPLRFWDHLDCHRKSRQLKIGAIIEVKNLNPRQVAKEILQRINEDTMRPAQTQAGQGPTLPLE